MSEKESNFPLRTKRQVMRFAHLQAYAIIQGFIDSGSEFETDSEEDRVRVESAMSVLAQRHFEAAYPFGYGKNDRRKSQEA